MKRKPSFIGSTLSKSRDTDWSDEAVDDKLAAAFKPVLEQLGVALKLAALGSDVSMASRSVGKFKGFATQNALKPPGAPVAKAVINPRKSLSAAIKPA